MLTVGSLFSGIGGFDLGFERAGMRVAWQSEIDPQASRVLAHHWPDVPNHGDITAIDGADLEPVDVITGGFPCQDLSVAGKRAGLAGERSGLFFEFMRIVREMRDATAGVSPSLVVIENVPGLLNSHGGADFGVLLDTLADLGALDIGWSVLDAQWFGVPQRRRRVFVVADFGGRRSAEILALSEGLSGHPPPRRATGQGVAGTPGGGAGERGWMNDLDHATYVPYDPAQTVSSKWSKGTGGPAGDEAYNLVAHTFQNTGQGWWNADETATTIRTPKGSGSLRANLVAHTLRADGFDASEDGTGRGTPLVAFTSKDHGADAGEVSPTLRAMPHDESHANGGGQVAVAFAMRGRAEGNVPEVSGDVSPAIRGASGGSTHTHVAMGWQCNGTNVNDIGTLRSGNGHVTGGVPFVSSHQMAVRRLTPRECERLQGFPDDFTLVGGMADGPRYRMLGNAVAVPVAEWLGRRIMEVLR